MPPHPTDATPGELAKLPDELRSFFADQNVPRAFVELLIKVGTADVSQLAGLGHSPKAVAELFGAIAWRTAGAKKKKAEPHDSIRIKSLIRTLLQLAVQRVDALQPVAAAGAAPKARERSEMDSDPPIDDTEKVDMWDRYLARYGARPAAYDRPHDRVLG